jgi:hypothetical protein
MCLDYSGGPRVKIFPCHGRKGNQLWIYDDEVCKFSQVNWEITNLNFYVNQSGFIIHIISSLCLTMDRRDTLSIVHCEGRITQRWKFGHYSVENAAKMQQ